MSPIDPQVDSRTSRRWRTWTTLVACLALAFALRGWDLHGAGFTADEVDELRMARAPLASIVLDDDEDRFPPLYRTVVALWIRAWNTDLASRWLNVLLGTGAVAGAWFAGRELLGRRGAWAPALLLACSPYHIHYCREGRAYALYVLLCALVFWGALRVLRQGGRAGWTALTLGSAAAVWTHYYAAPLVVVVWSLVTAACAVGRRDWKPLVAAGGVLLILLAPTPLLLSRALADYSKGRLVAQFDIEAYGYMLVNQAVGFSVGPSMQELRSLSAAEGVLIFLPWIAALGIVWLILGVSALLRLGPSWQLALLLITLLAVVPALGIAGNLAGVGFVDRYASWLCVPYALLVGAGASRCSRRWIVQAALVTLLAINALAVYNSRVDLRYAQEDYRAIAERLEELAEPAEAVLVASPHAARAVRYYVGESREVATFPIFPAEVQERSARIGSFLSERGDGERYWIVSQWLPEDDPRREPRDEALRELRARLRADLMQAAIFEAQAR